MAIKTCQFRYQQVLIVIGKTGNLKAFILIVSHTYFVKPY